MPPELRYDVETSRTLVNFGSVRLFGSVPPEDIVEAYQIPNCLFFASPFDMKDSGDLVSKADRSRLKKAHEENRKAIVAKIGTKAEEAILRQYHGYHDKAYKGDGVLPPEAVEEFLEAVPHRKIR